MEGTESQGKKEIIFCLKGELPASLLWEVCLVIPGGRGSVADCLVQIDYFYENASYH